MFLASDENPLDRINQPSRNQLSFIFFNISKPPLKSTPEESQAPT